MGKNNDDDVKVTHVPDPQPLANVLHSETGGYWIAENDEGEKATGRTEEEARENLEKK